VQIRIASLLFWEKPHRLAPVHLTNLQRSHIGCLRCIKAQIMMLEMVTEIFSTEDQLSLEEAELGSWAAAVKDDNWVRSMSA
jgi:hypothetical protein